MKSMKFLEKNFRESYHLNTINRVSNRVGLKGELTS